MADQPTLFGRPIVRRSDWKEPGEAPLQFTFPLASAQPGDKVNVRINGELIGPGTVVEVDEDGNPTIRFDDIEAARQRMKELWPDLVEDVTPL